MQRGKEENNLGQNHISDTCHLAVWPWAKHLVFFYLSFYMCEMSGYNILCRIVEWIKISHIKHWAQLLKHNKHTTNLFPSTSHHENRKDKI